MTNPSEPDTLLLLLTGLLALLLTQLGRMRRMAKRTVRRPQT